MVFVSPPSKSLKDVGLRAELNIAIILVSVLLMFLGTIIPPILMEYYELDLLLAISMGALVSIVGNLVLLYGLRNRLVKVFAVEFRDTITVEDKFTVTKGKAKDSTE